MLIYWPVGSELLPELFVDLTFVLSNQLTINAAHRLRYTLQEIKTATLTRKNASINLPHSRDIRLVPRWIRLVKVPRLPTCS